MPCQQPRSVPGGCASCPLSADNSVQACTLMGLSRVLASRPQAHNVGTEDSLGFGFHDHLNEIVLDVQCLSLSRVLVLVMTDEHFVSSVLGYRFLLFHPDPCNLGIGE